MSVALSNYDLLNWLLNTSYHMVSAGAVKTGSIINLKQCNYAILLHIYANMRYFC